jgi:charged multivesicular body protein 4
MSKWWRKVVTGDENTRVRDHLFGGSSSGTASLGRKGRDAFAAANSASFDAVIKNKQLLINLEKREAHLNKQIAVQMALARKKNAAKDKKGALFCLKKKKMLEGEITKIQGSRLTIEQQILSLEGATTNSVIVQGMSDANTALHKLNDATNVDKVDDLVADIQDTMADQQVINNIISQPVGMDMDEDDLLDELDALVMEDDVTTRPAAVPAAPAQPQYQFPEVPQQQPDFPTVPTHAVQAPTNAELLALQELEASM